MNVICSVKDYVTNVFDLHQGTGSGAIDVVAVQHEDGALHCSPFHVHFGKHKVHNCSEQAGGLTEGLHMGLTGMLCAVCVL